jgi:hypothetical protein
MKYESIADIYSANQKIRERLTSVVSEISPDEAATLPLGEKWTIQQILEHISMVGLGTSRICAKLLAEARTAGKPADGSFALSATFGERAAVIAVTKVEAPSRVQPTGSVTIPAALEGLAAAAEAFDSMRPDMEHLDLSRHTFPHPFFGELTAGEWMVVAGLHEGRHLQQIENVLAKVRAPAP